MRELSSSSAWSFGTDAHHTPTALGEAAKEVFAPLGSVAVNQPFRGTYVPLRHYGRDHRVTSIMLELRRDAYRRGDGAPDDEAIDRFAGAAARLLDGMAPGCTGLISASGLSRNM